MLDNDQEGNVDGSLRMQLSTFCDVFVYLFCVVIIFQKSKVKMITSD